MKKKIKIAFAIPTIDSDSYIINTIKLLEREATLFNEDDFTISFIICVNGENSDTVVDVVKRYFDNNSKFYLGIIVNKEKGKNKALNSIVNYTKEKEFDIIHFFDDDLADIKKGSMLENVKTLIENKDKIGTNIAVGSNFYAKLISLKDMDSSILKSIYKYFFQRLYAMPYIEDESDFNVFLAGYSICTWVGQCPQIPDDEVGIADDSFLSNYYALQGKNKDAKVTNIIKPKDSCVYFYVPKKFNEWFNQQIRVSIGVERSFRYFSDNYEYLQKCFVWRYSEFKAYRKNLNKVSVKHKLLLILFRICQAQIVKRANLQYGENGSIDWCIAKSSKIGTGK